MSEPVIEHDVPLPGPRGWAARERCKVIARAVDGGYRVWLLHRLMLVDRAIKEAA